MLQLYFNSFMEPRIVKNHVKLGFYCCVVPPPFLRGQSRNVAQLTHISSQPSMHPIMYDKLKVSTKLERAEVLRISYQIAAIKRHPRSSHGISSLICRGASLQRGC